MQTLTKIITITTSVLLMLSCGKNQQQERKQKDATSVKVAKVEYGEFSASINASGQIKAKDEADLSFKTGGVISKILVEEGQKVRKGQQIALLDLTEIESQLKHNLASLQKAEQDMQRIQILYNDNAATLEQLQAASTAYSHAKENHAVALFNKQYSVIISPFDGIVARKWRNQNEIVASGNPIVTVYETGKNNWIIKSGVADKEKVRIGLKDSVTICLDAFPNKDIVGSVSNIGEVPDALTGLYPIEIKLNANDVKLSSGLFAKISITPSLKQRNAIIPIEALSEAAGKQAYVYNADRNTLIATKHKIEISHFDNNRVYVSSGIENISEVIIQGSSYIEDGTKITIVN